MIGSGRRSVQKRIVTLILVESVTRNMGVKREKESGVRYLSFSHPLAITLAISPWKCVRERERGEMVAWAGRYGKLVESDLWRVSANCKV